MGGGVKISQRWYQDKTLQTKVIFVQRWMKGPHSCRSKVISVYNSGTRFDLTGLSQLSQSKFS